MIGIDVAKDVAQMILTTKINKNGLRWLHYTQTDTILNVKKV